MGLWFVCNVCWRNCTLVAWRLLYEVNKMAGSCKSLSSRIAGSLYYVIWIRLPEYFAIFAFLCKRWIHKANGGTTAPINIKKNKKVSKGVMVVIFSRCIKGTGHLNSFKNIAQISKEEWKTPHNCWELDVAKGSGQKSSHLPCLD